MPKHNDYQPPPRHFDIVYVKPSVETFGIKHVLVDPKPQPPEPVLTITRAEVSEPAPVALTPRQAKAFERQQARKRIEVDDTADEAKAKRGPAGTKSELASAQRNVDGGSAPCRLSAKEIADQDEAATARSERFERQERAKQEAKAKSLAPARPATITTGRTWRR
jgi:hypothetical protein